MRIEFVIDELVLVGFDPRERYRMVDAIERELAAATTPATMLPLVRAGRLRTLPDVGAGPHDRTAGASPEAVGRSVGNSIVGALGRAGGSEGGSA
jgi:hypothetical protein